MPSAQDSLYELFLEIAGERTATVGPVALAGEELTSTLKEVTRGIADVVTPRGSIAQTVVSAASGGGGGAVVDVLETVGSTILKNALGAAPLIRGILSLFGGGDSEASSTPLVKYALPPALHFSLADTAAGFRQVDFDQQGLARVVRPGGEAAPAAGSRETPSQQVTVNVQAMDARSFLDRSTEIAAAVREAMLNLNSLNDVVSEL